MCKYLLSLDYSTTCTGYAIFDLNNNELKSYGIIKPKVKNASKLKYPLRQLLICRSIAGQLYDLIKKTDPVCIVMEEVNRHKSRLSGKTLDGGHYLFYDKIQDYLDKLVMMDSDGYDGWRTRLGLRLDASDKLKNKERKKLNKKIKKGTKKLPIINKKHLACRYINKQFNLNFDIDKNKFDNDITDAIGLGWAWIMTLS